MLDLNALKEALKPLASYGRDEMTFQVGGMDVTIRPLLPMEEVAVQRYAASVLDEIQSQEGLTNEDQMSRAAALDYFDRFRIEIVANSIVQVNNLDLRNVKTLPTGEVLENGVAVQIPRNLAMREIVMEWSRATITICFQRYGDLVQKIADAAEKIALTTLPDLEAEIERVERRLESLKQDREERAKGDPSVTTQQITKLVQAGKQLQEEAEMAVVQARAQAARGTPERKSVVPPTSPPPTSGPPTSGPPTYKTTKVQEAAPANPSEFQSSFGDDVASEEARIRAARAAAAAAQREEPVDTLREAKPAGSVGGVDAYRLPSESLSPRGRSGSSEESDPVDSTKNPNFRSSR
jgi:hypothetical protein